jgi:hypothetical protein
MNVNGCQERFAAKAASLSGQTFESKLIFGIVAPLKSFENVADAPTNDRSRAA